MKIKKLNLSRSLLFILSTIISLLILKLLTAPFIYIGSIWIATILFICLSSKRNLIKIVGINLTAVVFALTVFEAYLSFKSGEFYLKRDVSSEYYKVDKFLGFAPNKEKKINYNIFYNDKVVFNADYSFDENGLRISPPFNDLDSKGSILFFGDSFTFGYGVNDYDTMPYQVGIKTNGKYRIYNFALSGYGPHQMLSQLEHDIVKNIVNYKENIYAIYQAIPDHINRSAGLSYWDYHGPRYVLGKNKEAIFAGNFDDITLPKIILKYLNQSLIYRDLIGNRRFFNRDKDIELFIGIVSAAKNNFEKLYPNGKFQIIFWDNSFLAHEKPEEIIEWMNVLRYFKDKGINVHLISNILPDYQNNRLKYDISPYDKHPNVLAHRLIAEYIVKNILK
jgi:hypothetical protein